ncbi:MAG: hypothetical protein JWL84_243 [Rhodospirillales bacterium]|jgi:hypothetical protein|nr:hypothetical protein [Rhodospirillales bacterium]
MRQSLSGALIAFSLLLPAAGAGAETVDLQLILAADVSRSIDTEEFQLQREGYAAALTDPRVLRAIQSGPYQSVAVTFVEWAGSEAQHVVVDWHVIRDDESAHDVANILLSAPRSFVGFTSISAAIDFSMQHFAKSGVDSERRVIDVSGDGTNNGGRSVGDARDEAVAAGVTINGLAILNLRPQFGNYAHTQPPEGLGAYYKRNVSGGPGSFVIVIEDFQSFAEALTNKLVTEIASAGPPKHPASLPADNRANSIELASRASVPR